MVSHDIPGPWLSWCWSGEDREVRHGGRRVWLEGRPSFRAKLWFSYVNGICLWDFSGMFMGYRVWDIWSRRIRYGISTIQVRGEVKELWVSTFPTIKWKAKELTRVSQPHDGHFYRICCHGGLITLHKDRLWWTHIWAIAYDANVGVHLWMRHSWMNGCKFEKMFVKSVFMLFFGGQIWFASDHEDGLWTQSQTQTHCPNEYSGRQIHKETQMHKQPLIEHDWTRMWFPYSLVWYLLISLMQFNQKQRAVNQHRLMSLRSCQSKLSSSTRGGCTVRMQPGMVMGVHTRGEGPPSFRWFHRSSNTNFTSVTKNPIHSGGMTCVTWPWHACSPDVKTFCGRHWQTLLQGEGGERDVSGKKQRWGALHEGPVERGRLHER